MKPRWLQTTATTFTFRSTDRTCHSGQGQLYSSVAPAQSIVVAHRKPCPGAFHYMAADFTCPPLRSPKTTALPSEPLRAAFTLRPEPADEDSFPIRRYVIETGQNPSPLSSLPRARHHPSARKRVRHCLAAGLAGYPSTPTCGPLPDWAFEPPGRPDPRHRKYHSRPPQSFPA